MPAPARHVAASIEAEALLDKAARCRRLARRSTGMRATGALRRCAAECKARAGVKDG